MEEDETTTIVPTSTKLPEEEKYADDVVEAYDDTDEGEDAEDEEASGVDFTNIL